MCSGGLRLRITIPFHPILETSTLGVVAMHTMEGFVRPVSSFQSLETCLRARPRFPFFRGYIDLVLAYSQMQMELKWTVVGVYIHGYTISLNKRVSYSGASSKLSEDREPVFLLDVSRVTPPYRRNGIVWTCSIMFPWLVGGLEHGFYFSIQLGMSSSQLTLTPSFFRWVGGEKPPTRWEFPQGLSLS